MVLAALAVAAVALFVVDPMGRVSDPTDDSPVLGYVPVTSPITTDDGDLNDSEADADEVLNDTRERDEPVVAVADEVVEVGFDTDDRGLRILTAEHVGG